MKVFYDEGPLRMKFGEAGEFRLGVPKEIPDYLAAVLLRKGLVKKWVDFTLPITTKAKKREV